MSLADELLNNLTDEEIAVYTTEDAEQNHIVIGADRFITVPSELKRIAVQHDENVEVVTFDCPRYWKNLDMSKMKIYINYMLPSGKLGCYCANNVVIDELDTNIMHFDWNITSNATPEKGTLSFLVCIKKKDAGGKTKNHWNSELNREMYVSAGLECEEAIIAQYPDIITQILEQIDGEVIIANNPAVDKSLTIEGFAADAKATGRAISVERARIDAIQAIPEGSTTADAALYDINIGYDGTDWKAPGAAVRGQATQLANYIDNKTSQLSDEIDNKLKKTTLSEYYKSDLESKNGWYSIAGEYNTSGTYNTVVEILDSEYEYAVTTYVGTSHLLAMCFFLDVNDNVIGYLNRGNNDSGTMYVKEHIDIPDNAVKLAVSSYNPQADATIYKAKKIYYENVLDDVIKSNILVNKTIVNFGDSIFGMFRDTETQISTSGYISYELGAKLYNCGFSGMRMASRGDHTEDRVAYNAFAMYAIADAICSKDYSLQDSKINFDSATKECTETFNTLKQIDFNKVDLITIAYGTNDYTGGSFKTYTDTSDPLLSVTGALQYSIRKIQETYPHIKILVLTPIWRYFGEIDGEDYKDSDTYDPNNTGTLLDFSNAIIEECHNLRIPVLDSYRNLSISKHNCNYYMYDKTHLNDKGRKLYAELISGKIRTLY